MKAISLPLQENGVLAGGVSVGLSLESQSITGTAQQIAATAQELARAAAELAEALASMREYGASVVGGGWSHEIIIATLWFHRPKALKNGTRVKRGSCNVFRPFCGSNPGQRCGHIHTFIGAAWTGFCETIRQELGRKGRKN
ncbi:MAG: hypothetical protein RIN56_15655 [Sporomusaceae bacterium]|nr:hypothetical protein [Sporomusaceae bacterium]